MPMSKPEFYAQGSHVFQSPLKTETGTKMGFMVLSINGEHITEGANEAAATIAVLANEHAEESSAYNGCSATGAETPPFNMVRERRADGSVWHVPVGVSLEEAPCTDPRGCHGRRFPAKVSAGYQGGTEEMGRGSHR